MNFIKRLYFVMSCGSEIEQMVKELREVNIEKERLSKLAHLNLCLKHQQKSPGTHHSEGNCDYCKLLASKDNTKTGKQL